MFDLRKEYCASSTQTHIADIDNRFRQEIEKSFSAGKVYPNTSPMRKIVLLSFPQSGVNALHIVIALDYFTLVCNVLSVLVGMVSFTMVKVDKFGKNKLIAVQFNFLGGKTAGIVVSKSEW